jgi:hypothetical protein
VSYQIEDMPTRSRETVGDSEGRFCPRSRAENFGTPLLVLRPNGLRSSSPGRSAAQAWDPEPPMFSLLPSPLAGEGPGVRVRFVFFPEPQRGDKEGSCYPGLKTLGYSLPPLARGSDSKSMLPPARRWPGRGRILPQTSGYNIASCRFAARTTSNPGHPEFLRN